jgi:mxaK protein
MSRWRSRDLAAFGVLAGALGAAGYFACLLARDAQANAAITALAAGREAASLPGEAANVMAARGLFLLKNRRVEEAQALAERMEGSDPAARATLLYALGNAHMRQALMIFASAPMRQVAPMISMAKSEYRLSLRLDPENWDARYNYDIAAALVRDADPPPSSKGEEMARERAYFPDVPGAPNGLP